MPYPSTCFEIESTSSVQRKRGALELFHVHLCPVVRTPILYSETASSTVEPLLPVGFRQ